jgi:UDP-N-acetylmuramoyl-L-alanyl-D-glutamate--2,6-diaminopimelate ligase
MTIPLPGVFNISNALAAIKFAESQNIPLEAIKKGIESLQKIRGRVEKVVEGQNFEVVVDYAHTDDSLTKLYETFKDKPKIAVLGSTGGGRDSWKRPVLGEIADTYCKEIIITNEDPYDEDPQKIMHEVAKGVTKHTPHLIQNRREAIRKALTMAQEGDVVLITGKGTDPYIMGPHGSKEKWDDAMVVREELKRLVNGY